MNEGINSGSRAGAARTAKTVAHSGARARRARKKIIWIRHNPLKNPDSAKENQANASFFIWFYLDKFVMDYASGADCEAT
jgi:hypothetical protein